MAKQSVKPFRPVYPSPAGLITSVDANGRPNVITLGEVFNISIVDPVIVGIAIAKPRYSHELISACGESVVNLPTAAMVEVVDRCGTVSGRDVDKFAEFNITATPATHVAAPLIAECPINLEGRLLSVQEVGDHDLFLGEVVAEHIIEEALDTDGQVMVDKLDPLCYMHGRYWSAARELGFHGYTSR